MGFCELAPPVGQLLGCLLRLIRFALSWICSLNMLYARPYLCLGHFVCRNVCTYRCGAGAGPAWPLWKGLGSPSALLSGKAPWLLFEHTELLCRACCL